ncbi:radical SAM superfamily protein [Clostridium argentinense CDC 2741]|uniref:Radical SAM superfamily protein n=1 Tax=Clostridium argentinense CDC 2741 TaxID=1418104 RepID=A0A0C1U3K8_9CLOT|nr:YgiQ family radical SAM protein [Clostridium argentinense]ARC85778.1 YgiQ family radical SAM protein [Clostridium argentinense]KIE46068.1 radical SAM superfamily protein [Clostridium argentinense CDC 2741]NFF39860.1 YgiQ family radical SAM protein [Clostridium argentinense]NFP51037.1 YgiQ family radical SAM protein [Clostridium argentinense]NFP73169.1 YgiQ family radical SAM protein [Clostridium argentinense]
MKLNTEFLPINKEDMKKRNIEQLDFIIITGDAYIDHPSFGTAIIGRVLESEGYTVGIIAQPNWNNVDDFKRLGEPKYGFLINSGNIDSMVNHYTAFKKRRSDDLYSPGGKSGYRPNRAVIVYSNRAREAYKNVPIIIGGIEASLRRFAHYDYWDDKVRKSILMDSKADLLIYGMGERPILEVAKFLSYGSSIERLHHVRGTSYITKDISNIKDYILLPSFEEVSTNKKAYAKSYKLYSKEQDSIWGKTLIEPYGDRYVVQTPPQHPLTEEEMDKVYNLPYTRAYHPIYEPMGGIPALQEVKFSITSHRGCFGSCSFCALTYHQGRVIQNRSQQSIIDEAKLLIEDSNFKGYIHDIGGPTANFRHRACKKQLKHGVCKDRQCMFPTPCKNLIVDHSEYLSLLRKVRALPKIKKVFIRSGIRYDYLMEDKNIKFFHELCEHHISGQLKVAPEHISDKVLSQMGKPKKQVYDNFKKKYADINKKLGKNQFVVPYLMSSHPGSDLEAAIELAEYIKTMGHMPEQVQDFYPTPGSLSTTIYYTGINPITEKEVYVPKEHKEKSMQRALLQFQNPENHTLVKNALIKANRSDLIGFGPNCLIAPRPIKKQGYQGKNKVKNQDVNKKSYKNKKSLKSSKGSKKL